MKNIHGEELNEELYLKKINEKLQQINTFIDECKEDSYLLNSDSLLTLIAEYGMLYYLYGSLMTTNDKELL